ncbi:lysozyme inhibitor LprI family protein [Pararhizobium mangrovi]|uniref:DUF1311 domain-containing protein n=1 Tax=Pararhizobium mangrovi TaxID=2590452 RepID=A0A506U7H1_9HYPH|nr:lysozyme inhibitor LprI family protein [Pararhizobium mangrovi]TPW29296.1 DUF1311 domain-containing protein [Pararhizobium mangrovi]
MRCAFVASFLVLCSVGIVPVAAYADDAPKLDCKDPQTQMMMNACAGRDFEGADAALNAVWPKAVAAARKQDANIADETKASGVPSAEEALRESERAWIAYRDAQCSYEGYAAFGGTMQPMLGTECKTRLTEARIAELKEAMKGLGN